MRERGIRPDLITFADTGAEMPHTMAYVRLMKDKVREWWGMKIIVARKLYKGKFEGLLGECLRAGRMPALAYGSRACSVKYKADPQSREIKRAMKRAGVDHCIRAIGFGADEGHRVKPSKDSWATNWYPLVDWQWRRADCIDAINRHGLPQPGKSACFFCPASKRSEVIAMHDRYPDLIGIALRIEQRAQARNTTYRGLGGEGNLWADWIEMDDAQGKLMLDIEPVHMPCGCIDG